LSNDGRRVLALDIGGTNFRLALVDEDGSILKQNRGGSRSEDGPEAAIRTVLEAAGDVLAGAEPGSLAGMGIAIAGLVTPKTGVLLTSPNLLSWYNTPVKDIFEREFRIPVYLSATTPTWPCWASTGSAPAPAATTSSTSRGARASAAA